ncbi:tetratricopeptide repeat protein [Psychroserpens algicola]|uniref:Tetratricopeptide repeat protein n=1 Tax=Psychroserpens algicola TaxID=1719034 RepID=A0ABT0HDQ5_9FLAO|nr:hypothetical protein [Psychroserpens algicola]MCK8481990.1 hypothetical protein [Psychroserpens algicola]
MGLKYLSFLLVLFCFSKTYAQDSTKETVKDTISLSEENTQKIIEFGKLIETAIHDSDPDKFVSYLNKTIFFDRVFSGYPNVDREDNFVRGFLIGMSQALTSFPSEIITEIENGAYYDFISYRYDDETQTYYALFRLYSSETGMNYHDYRVIKNNDELQFSDMYVYLTGEHFTNTIGRMMSYSIPESKLLGNSKSTLNSESKDLFKAVLLNNNGDYEKAFEIMDGLKSELSKEKFLLIFKSLIASQLDETKYLKSLEDLITTFPDDQTIALNKIDYHIFKEEYFEAIQVVNQLQNETEDDFLNFMKAGIAFEDNNYDLALNLYKYTIENYPDFFEGQAGYLSTLVMMKNYSDASKYLEILVAEGYEKQSLIDYVEEEDEFGGNILDGFTKSDEFKSWKAAKD